MKKICIVTGSRAEYGIMRPLIHKLNDDQQLHVEIIATAMHMEEKYGYTYKTIEQDGFDIVKKIPLHLVDTTKQTVVKSISLLQVALSEHFANNTYDLIIILGDRYEMLAVSNVALIYNIPVCHLHGGEKTLGNFDEYIRHAITKMSHLHLVSTENFRRRVIQLGEQPQRVINTGALGVENALTIDHLDKTVLAQQLNINLLENYYVVLFHPVTLDEEQAAIQQIEQLLFALDQIDGQYIFIGANSDTGSDLIMEKIHQFVKQHINCHLFASLTTQQYHSLIKHSRGLIGNSSSGLIEIPSLQRPTLNIGDRQKGRIHGVSVIDVPCETAAIVEGIKKMSTITDFTNPYYQPNSSEIAYQTIKQHVLDNVSTLKDFYDIELREETL